MRADACSSRSRARSSKRSFAASARATKPSTATSLSVLDLPQVGKGQAGEGEVSGGERDRVVRIEAVDDDPAMRAGLDADDVVQFERTERLAQHGAADTVTALEVDLVAEVRALLEVARLDFLTSCCATVSLSLIPPAPASLSSARSDRPRESSASRKSVVAWFSGRSGRMRVAARSVAAVSSSRRRSTLVSSK